MLSAAIIGCGPRGIEHACALKSVVGLELVAVVDRLAPVLRTAIDSLGVPGYLDVKELVERHRPDIAICATPARGRAELVMQLAPFPGIRAIVVEKPMAVTLAEAELMLGACTARGILLTVCHQLRFCDEFIAMKAAIDAGELGRIEFLRGSCYGNLLNQGPHLLDAIRWFAGAREILWIMSQWSDDPDLLARYTRGDQGYRNDDSHPAPMWMTHYLAFEGGLRATLETGLLYQRSGTFRGDWLQKRVSVTGSNGQAECQAAGYFRIISGERLGPEVRDGSIERYRAATRAFHEELRDALEAGIPHRNDAKDALKTLEAVIGCAQSAVDDAMAVLPLARDRDPISELETFRQAVRRDTLAFGSRRTIRISERIDRDATEPDISVIVTLPDDRGLAQECVKSWVHGQTYPRERFQLIVVTDGSDPNRDDRVKALLGPGDEFICHHTSNELHLYDLGARRAKGKLLFITEPHCIAERECLEELSAFFSTHDYDGACCRSIGICSNVMARMEERLFETGFRLFSQRGDWRKVILRGFAVYRDTYLEEGGFEYAYGRFAEWAFAARLHSRSRRLGYAAGAAVRHEYTTSFRELFPFVREFTRGECAYRLSAPPAYCEYYFGCAPEWSARELLRPSVASSACRAAWRSLWSGFRDGVGRAMFEVQAKTFLQALPIALLGPRWRVFEAAWALQIARARSRMWRLSDRRLLRAYSDAYDRMVRYSRLEYIAEYLASSGPVLSESYDYRVAEVSEERFVGFHALEQWEKESFRWSGPVSMVRISLAVASYEVQIDTRSLRRAPVPLCLSIFFNRVKLPSSSVQFKDGFVSFSIQPSMFVDGLEQRLILTCNPVRPWTFGVPDRRELGLPIFSIVFQPVE